MTTLLQDLRYGVRLLFKNPGFAVVAILTLALGIGANAAIFSLVNAILLRPLPYPKPEQLVGLGQWRNQQGEGYIQTGVSAPNVAEVKNAGVFQFVSYYRWAGLNLTEGDRPESLDSIKASADVLPMFGVAPLMGRFLLPEEMEPGHDQVCVIGNSFWQRRYGSDPAILGKRITLNQRPYTIVGVLSSSFRFTWDSEMDVFVPLVLTGEERSETGRSTSRDLQTQARLKDGVSLAQAQSVMDTLAASLAKKYPAANKGWGIKVEPLHDAYHRHIETPLMIMLGAVMLVLLIACVNVANLLLARASGRKREIGIRVAIGATRRRLLKQLLTESMLLSLCGGTLGLLLAYGGDYLLTLAMTRYHMGFPNAKTIEIDWRVLVFSVGVTVLTGLIFGLAPAWSIAKTELSETLKRTGLSMTTDAGGRRLRNALVVSEMALALVLLTGAGLLVRTFVELAKVDLGINTENVLAMNIYLPDYKYVTGGQQSNFFRGLLQKVEVIPGVRAAGAQSGNGSVFFQPQGQSPATPGHEPTANLKTISPGFLKAMGTKLILGRTFTERDNENALPVALISETVARRYWPQANPLGQTLTMLTHVYSGEAAGNTRPVQIVGVVQDVRSNSLWRPEAAIYVPFAQKPGSSILLSIRTAGPPLTVVRAVRDAVLSLDKEQPIDRVRTMEEVVSQTYGSIRFPMTLLWIFSGLALVLSAVGTFGVMSYAVSRRTKEIAIRRALGASGTEMLQLVLREGIGLTLIWRVSWPGRRTRLEPGDVELCLWDHGD